MPPGWDAHWLLHELPDAVVVVSADGVVQWANAAATDQLGWRLEDWLGRQAMLLVHPDDVGLAAEALETVRSKELGTPIELRVRVAGGGHRLVELRGRSVVDGQSDQLVVLLLRDITERRRWEVSGGDSALMQTLVEYSPVITLLVDGDCRVRSASAALVRRLGHPLEATAGRHLDELVAPADRGVLAAAFTSARTAAVVIEARLLNTSGAAFPHQLTIVNLLEDPVVHGMVVTAQDITALVDARQQLHHLATHDPLTGVLNRAGLLSAITDALDARHPLGVVFLDLDGFKWINDQYGHRAGDLVLVEVGRRIQQVAGQNMVGRLGGDEFVILADQDVSVVVSDLLTALPAALGHPVPVAGDTLTIRAAYGAAIAQPGDDPASLLAAADAFMYDAKRRQLNRTDRRAQVPRGTDDPAD
jgi:diguanylate cyclase (GGDEF)-like protein/PAS domain S-box-containing protein